MEKIFIIALVLASLLGVGAVGTMIPWYDMGMMQGNYYSGTGSRSCPMMDFEEIQGLPEDYREYMEDYCTGFTYEECKEIHEECEEYMHEYCEHYDENIGSRRNWYGRRMMC